jgi:hypothetical protein
MREKIMLKFENLANVGDVIKAFDFQPMSDRPDMFLVGRVVAKGAVKHPEGFTLFDGYTVEILDQGKENRYTIGEIGYVPFETSFLEYDERVTVVATADEMEDIAEEFGV